MTTVDRAVGMTLPARPLACYRVLLGLVAGAKAVELGMSPLLGTTPTALLGVGPTVPAAAWLLWGTVMGLAALAVVVGWRTRPAAAVVAVCTAGFVWGAGYYSNHTYLLVVLAALLATTDADAVWSARAARGRGAQRVWAVPVLALRAQISVVYLFAALGKINLDFLSGNGLASWAVDSPLVPAAVLVPAVLVPAAVGAVVTELFVAVALWWRRTWAVAAVAGVALHAGMIAVLSEGVHGAVELSLFALLTAGGYVLFAPQSVADRLPGAAPPGRHRAGTGRTGETSRRGGLERVEGHGGGRRDVERVDARGHRDTESLVGRG